MKTLRIWVAALAVLMIATTTAWAADGVWRRIETENFIVFAEGDAPQALQFARDLELYRGILMHDSPPRTRELPPSPKLNVFLTNSVRDFAEVSPGISSNVAGFYTSSPDITVMFSTVGGGGRASWERQVLFHEYAHHYMLQYFPGFYPAWYVEAFAEFYMTTQITDDHVTIGAANANRADWLSNGGWISMEQLVSGDPSAMSRNDVARFYAQAWLFNHYLTFDPARRQQLVTYINALRRGEDAIAAFEPSFGVGLGQMQSMLRNYGRRPLPMMRYTWGTLRVNDQARVTRLPRVADRLLLPLTRMRLGRLSKEDAAALLAEIPRRIPAGAENDPWVLRVRALAQILAGDAPGAQRTAEALLAAAPNDAEALDIVGRAQWERVTEVLAADADPNRPPGTLEDFLAHRLPVIREASAASKQAFNAALASDPLRPGTLMRRSSTHDRGTEAGLALQLDDLRRAREMAPYTPAITLRYGNALFYSNQHRQAIRAVQRLAADPHGGESRESAQALIARAQAALTNAAPAPAPAPAP